MSKEFRSVEGLRSSFSFSSSNNKMLSHTKTGPPSRLDLQIWVNKLLNVDYIRLQQCADGLAYAQILNILHPSKIPLHLLNFHPESEYDFIQNLKIISNSMRKLGLKYDLDADKFAKGKMQDQYDFLRWLYTYYQTLKPPGGVDEQLTAKCAATNTQSMLDRNSKARLSQLIHRSNIKQKEKKEEYKNKNIFNSKTSNNNYNINNRIMNARKAVHTVNEAEKIKEKKEKEKAKFYSQEKKEKMQFEEENDEVNSQEDLLESCIEVILPLKHIIYDRLKKQEDFYESLSSLKQERQFYFDKLKCIKRLILAESEGVCSDFAVEILSIIAEKPDDF